MYGFATVPCPKCGTAVQVAPQVATGVCPKCYSQVSMSAGAPQAAPAAPPFGAPQQPGYGPPPGAPAPQMGPQMGQMPVMSAYAGRSKASIFGGIGVAVVLGLGAVGYSIAKKQVLGPGPGKVSYSSVGVDKDKADGDKMITGVAAVAKKWQSDAVWWSVNYQAVRPDGTVDVSKGAEVEYVSPKKVTSISKKLREDGIKKFHFTTADVDYHDKWNALNQWHPDMPDAPKCSLKDLTKKLADKGFKGDKTVRISFDPAFDWGDIQTWHVWGDDTKIAGHYSMKDCSEVADVNGAHSNGDDEE